MKNKIILFDIDYTLFDTTFYKELVAHALSPLFSEDEKQQMYPLVERVYYDIRDLGNFNPKLFAEALIKITGTTSLDPKTIENILWDKALLKKAMYPEVENVLKSLYKNNLLGIFSTGDTDFQNAKIAPIQHLLTTEHIHIYDMKDKHLPELIDQYKNEDIVLVDDFISILADAKQQKPDIISIWMRRGKFAEKMEMTTENMPDYTIYNLEELVPLFDK